MPDEIEQDVRQALQQLIDKAQGQSGDGGSRDD
jgi:hypothetical protein